MTQDTVCVLQHAGDVCRWTSGSTMPVWLRLLCGLWGIAWGTYGLWRFFRRRRPLTLLLVPVLVLPASCRKPAPPPPPPPAIVPPIPAPLPPPPAPIPPPPPLVELSGLEVYPQAPTLVAGDSVQLCAYFRFASGRVAIRPADIGRCGADYLARFTALERQLTLDELAWITCTGRYLLAPGCYRVTPVKAGRRT